MKNPYINLFLVILLAGCFIVASVKLTTSSLFISMLWVIQALIIGYFIVDAMIVAWKADKPSKIKKKEETPVIPIQKTDDIIAEVWLINNHTDKEYHYVTSNDFGLQLEYLTTTEYESTNLIVEI